MKPIRILTILLTTTVILNLYHTNFNNRTTKETNKAPIHLFIKLYNTAKMIK